MIGVHQTSKGNWRCDFCVHTSWKTQGGTMGHVEREHPKDLRIQRLAYDLERERNKPPKERIVYRDPPKPAEKERYSAVVYCPTCLSVDSVRIIHGQAVGGGGCFRCGNLGGQLVEHVNVQQGDYKIVGS